MERRTMATASGIWNHGVSGAVLTQPADTTGSSSDNTSSDSATISANDFLTLLVTEMQNQDPTADTDPNEYINQLVNVNSLEQLININQTLTTAYGSTATTPGSRGTDATKTTGPQTESASLNQPSANSSSRIAPGNLSVPATSPAAERVGESLSGR
jgi:flagellar basal-body rod modification protein FlgD